MIITNDCSWRLWKEMVVTYSFCGLFYDIVRSQMV
jgi:hypothetical protein